MQYYTKDQQADPVVDIFKTEEAISFIKRYFQDALAESLNLMRVSAPLFVSRDSGIQDNLNGIERPVSFPIKSLNGKVYEIVQSLAKWKRFALARYKVPAGKGIYTDMNALRPDEEDLTTSIHSVYVDQWDWEKVMSPEERNLEYLKSTVRKIYQAIRKTENAVCEKFSCEPFLPEDIAFVHTEDLLSMYPGKKQAERENAISMEKKAVFIIGIGGELQDGSLHDGRAPDYDDWTTPTGNGKKGLNGDIFVWNPVLERGFEISSMGIRVDRETMIKQLEIRGCKERMEMPWHSMLLAGKLPQSVGGGIGQSRLCMLLLRKHHIGEVQVSVWPEEVQAYCSEKGINLL